MNRAAPSYALACFAATIGLRPATADDLPAPRNTETSSTQALPPADAAAGFRAPEGFRVGALVAESDVPHPMAMALTSGAPRLLALSPIALLPSNVPRYHSRKIRSFRDKETERIFLREPRAKSSRPLQRAALRKLLLLHAAESLNDLLVPPGNRLEKLGGGRSGQYSIRINDQWRICFIWEDGHAHEVEIVDYH